MLRRYWQSDVAARPSFGGILKLFEANSKSTHIELEEVERMKIDDVQALATQHNSKPEEGPFSDEDEDETACGHSAG